MEAFHAVVSRNDQLAAAQERIAALEAALGWALAATDACRNELMPERYTWSEQARAALAGSQGGGGETRQDVACTETVHRVQEGADACVCGENRMELML